MVGGRPVTVVDDSEPVNTVDISTLTNEEVWRRFLALAAEERVVIADLIASVAEVERRNLVKDRKWPNLFEYCVCSLHWSESAAYRRIRAARAVRRYPIILEMLRDGRLHLEGVVILHAFIDDADFASLLLNAVGRTTKAIESLVTDRRRDPPVRDSMRFVGISTPPVETAEPPAALDFPPSRPRDDPSPPVDAPPSPAVVSAPPPTASAASKLVRIAFTADEGLHRMVLHAQQLMRHKYPSGSLEGIFRDALGLLIEKKDLGIRAEAAAKRRARRTASYRSRGSSSDEPASTGVCTRF